MSSSSYAALSATTANTIEGSEPYFTLDGTKMATTDELLGFTYPDITVAGGLVQIDATKTGTTITVPQGTKENDIKTLITSNGTGNPQALLGALSATAEVGLEVDDDDGDKTGGVSASGALIINFIKDNIIKTPGTDVLSACSSYQLTISIDNPGVNPVTALTTYGAPNKHAYTGATTAIYTIMPKVTTPYACFAIPASGASYSGGYPVNAVDFNTTVMGFIPKTGAGAINFPTTASHGLYFDLTFAGAKASDVTVSGGGSGVTLTSNDYGMPNGNKLKLTFNGPRDSNRPTAAYTPVTFDIKVGATSIYKFRVNQWFIARPGEGPMVGGYYPGYWGLPGGYDGSNVSGGVPGSVGGVSETALNYCGTTLPGYQVPSRGDFTNSSDVSKPTGTSPTLAYDSYTRAIGGGLFAEWGITIGKSLDGTDWHPIQSGWKPYPQSDWEDYHYWTSELWATGTPYVVYSYGGTVSSTGSYNAYIRAACVSP